MADFGDSAFAARLRDYIRREIKKLIDSERPRPSYATVTSIDRLMRSAMVQYEGDPDPVPVQMGSVQPLDTGQQVRIEGVSGNKFIADVVGPVFVDQVLSAEGWHYVGAAGEPAFTNSWVNFGAPRIDASFRVESDIVRLQGSIKTGTIGQPAFTLPAGYRPSGTIILGTISSAAAGRVDIAATGTVTPASPSTNTEVSLDGLVFVATQ